MNGDKVLAFPTIGTIAGKPNALGQAQMMSVYQSGMTLRDYFAAQLLSGMMRMGEAPTIQEMPGIAHYAYMMADAMLVAGNVGLGKEAPDGK